MALYKREVRSSKSSLYEVFRGTILELENNEFTTTGVNFYQVLDEQRALRWFGFEHVKRLDEYRMARRVLMAEGSGRRVRGKPMIGWMDDLKVAFGNRGMTVEAQQCEKDSKDYRVLVHMQLNEFHATNLLDPVFFRTALPCSGGYHLERGGMRLR